MYPAPLTPHPLPPLVPLHYPTRHLCLLATESERWPPMDWLQRDRQNQPQHADLPATTAIYTGTLEQSGFQYLVWNVHTQRQIHTND